MENQASAKHWLKWFDPRNRSVSTWAFILNRVTGLGLTLYLFLHLMMLGQLAKGPEAYNGFIALVKNPIFTFGEVLVVTAGIIHGLNGIRVGLAGVGIGARYQRSMFYILFLLAVILSIYFAAKMLLGA